MAEAEVKLSTLAGPGMALADVLSRPSLVGLIDGNIGLQGIPDAPREREELLDYFRNRKFGIVPIDVFGMKYMPRNDPSVPHRELRCRSVYHKSHGEMILAIDVDRLSTANVLIGLYRVKTWTLRGKDLTPKSFYDALCEMRRIFQTYPVGICRRCGVRPAREGWDTCIHCTLCAQEHWVVENRVPELLVVYVVEGPNRTVVELRLPSDITTTWLLDFIWFNDREAEKKLYCKVTM